VLGSEKDIPSGPKTTLNWTRLVSCSENWPIPPNPVLEYPIDRIVLPFDGIAEMEVYDVDFNEHRFTPEAAYKGDRGIFWRLADDSYSIRASDIEVASKPSVVGLYRTLEVNAGQVLTIMVMQTSGFTLKVAGNDLWIKYL
jgi:hypothetical protein